jgi:hypothetical protein
MQLWVFAFKGMVFLVPSSHKMESHQFESCLAKKKGGFTLLVVLTMSDNRYHPVTLVLHKHSLPNVMACVFAMAFKYRLGNGVDSRVNVFLYVFRDIFALVYEIFMWKLHTLNCHLFMQHMPILITKFITFVTFFWL